MGPAWLSESWAVVMLAVAGTGAARLTVARRRKLTAGWDVDLAHVVMGVAMAAMFAPWLDPVPAAGWVAVFSAAAAWFAWRLAEPRASGPAGRGPRHQHLTHLVGAAAMVFMAAAMPAARPTGAVMTRMGVSPGGGVTSLLAIALAAFLIGHAVTTADGLTQAPGPARRNAGQAPAPRLAGCCHIAMSVAMGYLLITMV